MGVIRVVWGSATGPTATASYDAALAAANVHNYNLVTVSSVIPADANIEVVGTAPDLGPTGNRLTVVQSRDTVGPDESRSAVAGLGWARSESGRGIFYEDAGSGIDETRKTIESGLAFGKGLRDWTFIEEDVLVRNAEHDDGYTTLVVCAVYGESTAIL